MLLVQCSKRILSDALTDSGSNTFAPVKFIIARSKVAKC